MKDKGYDVEWYIAQLKQDIKGLKEAYNEELKDTKTYIFNDVNEGTILNQKNKKVMKNSELKNQLKNLSEQLFHDYSLLNSIIARTDDKDNEVFYGDEIVKEYQSLKTLVDNNSLNVSYRLILSKISDSWNHLEENPESPEALIRVKALLKESVALQLALIDKISTSC